MRGNAVTRAGLSRVRPGSSPTIKPMPDTKRTASGVFGGLLGLVGLSAAAGVLITATVTPAIAVSGAAATSAITMFDNLPSVLDIDKLMLPTTFYYTNPDTGEARRADVVLRPEPVPVKFDQVAPVMYDAILSSEDPRFYQHGGVDLIGTSRAVLQNLRGGGETQGGSSISQQYVKNVLIQRCERGRRRDRGADREVLANCWTRGDDRRGQRGHRAQAPGDALRDPARAEVLQERHPSGLPEHRELRRHAPTASTPPPSTTSASTAGTLTLARPRRSPASCRTRTRTASTSPTGRSGTRTASATTRPPTAGRRCRRRTPGRAGHLLAEGTITQEQYLAAATGTARRRAGSSTCSAACWMTARSPRSSTSRRRSSRSPR